MTKFLRGAALLLSALSVLAFRTSPTIDYHPPDAVGMPAYRYMSQENTFGHYWLRICEAKDIVTEDLVGGSITWGGLCTHQGYSIDPWDASRSYVWLENSKGTATSAIPNYSKRLLIQTSTWEVRRGLCGYAGDSEDNDPNTHTYVIGQDGDDRWHPSISHTNKRVQVTRVGDDWWLRWFDVVNCKLKKEVKLLDDNNPATLTGGLLDPLGWSWVHNLGNFKGNMDDAGRYLALDGCETAAATSSCVADKLVVLDMGTTDAAVVTVSNEVDLCAAADWSWNTQSSPTCPGLRSGSGFVTMSNDAKYVIVKYPGQAGMPGTAREHTRVFDFTSATMTVAKRDLTTGSDATACPCWGQTVALPPTNGCRTGSRVDGFGPFDGSHRRWDQWLRDTERVGGG